jgi:hypothetical protein
MERQENISKVAHSGVNRTISYLLLLGTSVGSMVSLRKIKNKVESRTEFQASIRILISGQFGVIHIENMRTV